tara:strand:+ start:1497 stop:3533 length:2037 start_codon:yes stop_codon:yes gene_type:complete
MRSLFTILLVSSFCIGGLLKPENNSYLNQIHVQFEWEQVPNNAFYILDVSENINDIDGDCIICDEYIYESLIHIDKDLIDWNKTYHWKIIAYSNDGENESFGPFTFTTNSAISNTSTNLINESSQEGLTIFGSFFDYYSAVIDQDGKEIWNTGDKDIIFYNTDEYGRFFGSEYVGNNVENNYPGIKFSFENGIEWQEPGENFIHHDIFQLPNGNYIGLGTSSQMGPIPIGNWTPLFQSLGFVADGETIEFEWLGDKIIEWDADTKEEVWTWDVFDYFSMEDFDILGGIWFEAYNTNRFDWTHANAIWYDEDDSALYLSSRHLSRITKIAYPSGEVVWNLGRELGSGDIDCGHDLGFSFQHSVTKLENGNILTFDNGNLSTEYLNQDVKTSRSIEIEVEETSNGCDAQLGWEYVLPENLYGYLSGNTQKLSNGNYLSTTIGDGGTSVEVNQNGELVWQANYNLSLPDGLVYRAMKIPGIFPASFSLIFPQLADNGSEINIQGTDSLNVLIKNNGDYKQIFNYEISYDNEQNMSFNFYPIHHPEENKNKTYKINSAEFEFNEYYQGTISLMPGQKKFLTILNEIVLKNSEILPEKFEINNIYPNPFNPSTTFEINALENQYTNIDIYDISGKKIDNIYNGYLRQGSNKFKWDGSIYPSGIYFLTVKSEHTVLSKKINLLK